MCTTHGHELRGWEMLEVSVLQGGGAWREEKNWGNCNSVINKIYLTNKVLVLYKACPIPTSYVIEKEWLALNHGIDKKPLVWWHINYYLHPFNDKPPSPPKRKMEGEEADKTWQTPWKNLTTVEKWESTRSTCGSLRIYAYGCFCRCCLN